MDIKLRKVEKNEWDFILKLRNSSYKFFYKQNKPITRNEHYEYLENQVKNNDFHQWIISYYNKNVGYIRILNHDVSIMIQKEFQNKGIASSALYLLEKEAINLGIKKLIAVVAPENKSSEKIFRKNNFIKKSQIFQKNF